MTTEMEAARDAAVAKWIADNTMGELTPHEGAIKCFKEGYNARGSQWVAIQTEDDLPKEYGEYWATTIVSADPIYAKREPRVIKASYNDQMKERFWLGSFSAWMPIIKPEPYTADSGQEGE